MVTNKQKYIKKYGFKAGQAHSKKDISKTTGIPIRILNVIYDRGLAAHKNNPTSVRNLKGVKGGGGKKMSAQQWAAGRIYSFVMKAPGTWGRADKDQADRVRALKKK